MKTCTRCDEWLPLDNYYRDPRNIDGRAGSCKQCQREAARASSKRRYVVRGTMTQPRTFDGRFSRVVFA